MHDQRRMLEPEDHDHIHSGDHSFLVGGDAHHVASVTLVPHNDMQSHTIDREIFVIEKILSIP